MNLKNFSQHTSAALTINENYDKGFLSAQFQYSDFLKRL
jgi:thiamine phosphate synthase YjbQ (UPF0047 family)